jgi:hypothetical protein
MSRKSPLRQPDPSTVKKWADPVKNLPARESTLNIRGDFGEFKELMRKVVGGQKPSSSHDPASS